MKKKLQRRFIDEYIKRGFRYGGMIPLCCLSEEGYDLELIKEIKNEGFIQLRDCEDFSYELTISERRKINEVYDLKKIWLALESAAAYSTEIEYELKRISNV